MNIGLMEYIELQCLGARVDGGDLGRRGGAGPADAKAFVFGDRPLMVPTLTGPAKHSAYALKGEDDERVLQKDGRFLGTARAVARPKFYGLDTADGVSYAKIALLHGSDCLASTVVQECARYNEPAKRCRFCAIGLSLARGATIHTKTPQQLAEVAAAAKALDGVRHVTLTSGSSDPPDEGALYLGKCARAIRQSADLPVEIQFEPPRDTAVFAELRRLGVGDVGLHIESFDQAARERFTPGKAAVSVDDYFAAFDAALAVFGKNRVSTFVICGLGEDEELTKSLCRRAAAMGVYPYLAPLRPMQGTFMAKASPPEPAYLYRVVTAVGAMLREYGLSSKQSGAGCVRCRACSALQFVE
jgi:radical SAM protein (TIGR04043 family)